jgi:glyoxylase-like metal-dependent hydrolase (beta-lactamase superfamily II)
MAAGTLALQRGAFASLLGQQQPAIPAPAPNSLMQSLRAAGATTPIQVTKLTDTIFLLQGVGGNMVAQNGPDGKLLIDSSVATAAPALLHTLEKLGTRPPKLLINTHWHFDHTDGNAAVHDAGAFIIAQENTRLRLSTPQKVKLFNLDFPASPTGGLPQLTFADNEKLFFDNDELDMIHAPNAHTDSDIFVHFVNGNVIHTGDLWFNGFYPVIDEGTGGTVNGMIQGVDKVLAIADDRTKIVPGHGPLGDKRALQKYRDMLSTVANRIEKLKIAGQTLEQVVAAKPTADLDGAWGSGRMTPDLFVTVVYNTL